jgi:hypothetical protein
VNHNLGVGRLEEGRERVGSEDKLQGREMLILLGETQGLPNSAQVLASTGQLSALSYTTPILDY